VLALARVNFDVMLLTPSMKLIIYVAIACLVVLGAQPGSGQSAKDRKRHPPNNPFIDRQLSGPVTLTSEWLEFKLTEPLKVARDTQELTLFPDPPIQMVFARGTSDLIPADGRNADIESELIGSDGIAYHSRPGRSETMTGNLKITSRLLGFKDLPNDVTFTQVRIKSSARYPVSKILWRCYNWGEVHH
jgi:hypothetical protein